MEWLIAPVHNRFRCDQPQHLGTADCTSGPYRSIRTDFDAHDYVTFDLGGFCNGRVNRRNIDHQVIRNLCLIEFRNHKTLCQAVEFNRQQRQKREKKHAY